MREALASEPIPPGRETPLRRVALERRPIQVADIQNDPGYSPPTIYRAEGMRTSMAVPLLKEGELMCAGLPPSRGAPVHRAADEHGGDLCRPGRDRH
jgi:hypothetical protein